MISSPIKTAYIVRRQASGGGAEQAAKRLAEHLSADWKVHRLSAGMRLYGRTVAGTKGPGWWRAVRFARNVDALLKDRPGVILSLERGPDCHIYRAGDGVHLRWRMLRFGSSPIWMINSLHWLYPRLEAKTVHSARFVAANSKMVRREMETYYPWAAPKLRVVPNGYDPAVFFPDPVAALRVKTELGLSEPQKLFLFVGSGWERKGLGRAMELVAGYNQTVGPDQSPGMLLVVGKGNPKAYAERMKGLNLMDHVRFVATRPDIVKFFQAADFFLLPTLYDPFSNACLEALACGCPVVTTQTNGLSEFIDHGRTGFILDDDPHAAVAWMRTAAIERGKVADSVAILTVEHEMRAFSDLMEACSS
ncbi:MAG TPA: glycosyltransferase family 1 protein [Desulfonatronum sp.]|nr:glycosyltransferase family 1 protein [Desulfonatronum sp.]